MFSLLVFSGFMLFFYHSGRDTAEPPPVVRSVVSVLEPGLPVVELLRYLGSPACKAPLEAGERWVYARGGLPSEACLPDEGDLIIVVQNGRVVRFTPEYGRSMEVQGPQDLVQFRRAYSVEVESESQ